MYSRDPIHCLTVMSLINEEAARGGCRRHYFFKIPCSSFCQLHKKHINGYIINISEDCIAFIT